MTQRRLLVVANWKMNGLLGSIRPLLTELRNKLPAACDAEVVICPPYIYLPELIMQLQETSITLGAQNVSHIQLGAFTGEIAAEMLKDFQCGYVIVGHSERRMYYDENDHLVAKKFQRAQDASLVPILCVGEQLEDRQSGATQAVIERQLQAVIDIVGIAAFNQAVVAYEPVWAIGTGETATPEQAQEVHAFLRLLLARHNDAIADQTRIIYGGSVRASNARDILNMADIDGGLIGGASLSAAEFSEICQTVRDN